jgi:hypothetical protein
MSLNPFKNKAYNRLYSKLIDIAGIDNIKNIKSKAFDYEMLIDGRIYLIKMIYHPNKYEININSRKYWQVNRGIVSSRKSGEQMLKVYDLINFDLKENNYPKNTIKLYVIYPFSKRLLKVINECEMIFIKPNVDIYGCHIVNFNTLEEDIHEIKKN